MAPSIASAAILAASALVNPIAFSGPGRYEKGQEYFNESTAVVERRVPFDLWYPNKGDAPHWELSTRLEVASVPGSLIPNAQRLSTVYSFNIPGGQNLTEVAAGNSVKMDQENFCVTILETPLSRPEAKRYNEKKEKNFGCTRVFAKPCMLILQRLASKNKPGPDGCKMSNVDFTKIRQCEYIFAKTRTSSRAKLSTFNLLKPGLDLSGGFAHITSDTYDGSNSTFADVAEDRIHSVMIESGDVFTPVCMKIADKKKKGDKSRPLIEDGMEEQDDMLEDMY